MCREMVTGQLKLQRYVVTTGHGMSRDGKQGHVTAIAAAKLTADAHAACNAATDHLAADRRWRRQPGGLGSCDGCG